MAAVIYGTAPTMMNIKPGDVYAEIAKFVKETPMNMTTEQLYAQIDNNSLTETQRPLYNLLQDAKRMEADAERSLDAAKAAHAQRKERRVQIEHDLKKLGWKPAKR